MRTIGERNRFFGFATFDEAIYYQGSTFELGGKSRQYRPDDLLMEEAMKILESKNKLTGAQVRVQVEQGVVTLSGQVSRLSDKLEIENGVDEIPGVLDIQNELKVSQFLKSR